jgi:hypothetical protein
METKVKIWLEEIIMVKVIRNNWLVYNYNINLNEYCIHNICRVTVALLYKLAKTWFKLSGACICAGKQVELHIDALNDASSCLNFLQLRGLCHF